MLCNWSPQNTFQDIINEFKIYELQKKIENLTNRALYNNFKNLCNEE